MWNPFVRLRLRAQRVNATPSGIKLFSKAGTSCQFCQCAAAWRIVELCRNWLRISAVLYENLCVDPWQEIHLCPLPELLWQAQL